MDTEQAADALTGLLLTSPIKKPRTSAEAGNTVAGYSPELSKALKSVVKIFTTMARCAQVPGRIDRCKGDEVVWLYYQFTETTIFRCSTLS